MAEQSKHREISSELSAEIAAGKYAAGRLPSEAQLVKRFGVSRPTVARALRDLQAAGLIVRRAGSGTFIKDQAPLAPPGRQLALIIPSFRQTEIFELICGELASLARAHDYALLWSGATDLEGAPDDNQRHALELSDQLIERRVAGVFFAPFEPRSGPTTTNRAIADRLQGAGIPLVLFDRDLGPFPTRCELDLVGIDNFTAGYLLGEHLVKLGCRRVTFWSQPLAAGTIDARIAGVREALVRFNVELEQNWITVADPEDSVRVQALLLGGQRPDAIVCGNDLTAALLLRTLERNQVRVPHDVRVVGFDDAKYATLVSVPLTTIHQPCREIAITAFRAMLERIADPSLPPRSLLLTPRLVVRESCGAYLNLPKPQAALAIAN
jgi:LacI family transcriptional regulator